MTNQINVENVVIIGTCAIYNCTPHDLNIVRKNGTILTVKPSGIVPRCASTEEQVGIIGDSNTGIEITQQQLGEVTDLPDPEPGTRYIVSRMVANAATNRDDLLVPGSLIRNDQGQVVGCKGLTKVK